MFQPLIDKLTRHEDLTTDEAARPSMISAIAPAASSTVRSSRRCSLPSNTVNIATRHISRNVSSIARPAGVSTDSG